MFDPENLTDQEISRLNNLDGLRAAGVEPYPARVRRTHTIAEARALHDRAEIDDQPVSIAGRIRRMRIMGKMSFADLEDGTGTLQIVLRKNALPDNFYDEVWKKLIDLGDFVSATGPLFVTKTGELSVEAREVEFLAKALKPMPDKWHGVRDQEKRFRRRYVDLL
ncbi:MAG: lysine--tRNA ligase, partial [Caldilineaceae bacterium]|nr:lysine--tRNA ligase [Caldilineaceae bacterium]